MQLSAKQLAQFHHDGFIVLRGFLDENYCSDILDIVKEHLENKIEPIETEIGYDSRSKEYRSKVTDYSSNEKKEQISVRRLRQVYERNHLFKEWMENEKIRPILQQILGGQVVLTTAHHNSIMTKLPHVSKATSWHQDRRYWQYSDDNLISVWLALNNETSENGVLEFIPGSHTMKFKPGQFDDKEYFSEHDERNKHLIATKSSTMLEKGDVILFHSLLLHRANKNSTNEVKVSFVYTVKGLATQALKGSRSAEFRELLLPLI